MIQFYNKFILFLLPLSILPIILHLLFFKKAKVVEFTYVNLINKILKQYLPRRKIIDLIILILRCLIIFFLILYLAKPVLYFNPLKNKLNILVALDNSCSTRQKIFDKTKFDLLKIKIENFLKFLKEKDVRVKIVTFNEEISELNNRFDFISSELIEKIRDLQPTYKSTDISVLINYLLNVYQKEEFKDSNNKVVVFTDFAEHLLSEVQSGIENRNNIEVLFCYPNLNLPNFAVEDLYLTKEEDNIQISYKPVSFLSDAKKLNVKLLVFNQQVDSSNIDFLQKNFRFNYILDKNINKNWLWGCINLPQDGLLEDNNFYFTFYINEFKQKILCLMNEPEYFKGIESKKFYFEKLKDAGLDLDIVSINNREINFDLFSQYDIIILVGVEKIDEIVNYCQNNNKILVVFPEEKIDLENYEKSLDGIEFIELKEQNINQFFFSLGEDEYFNKFIEQFDYKNISVNKKFLLSKTKQNWSTLLNFNDNTSALVKKDKIYLFSFSIDRKWSNLVYKPLFVGLMKFISNYNSQQKKIRNYFYVSEEIPVTNIEKIKNITDETIEDWVMKETSVKFNTPGIYEIYIRNEDRIYIAVNTPLKESNIILLDKNKLKNYFKKQKILIDFLDTQKTYFERDLIQWCFGKEFSKDLLYTAVLLFIIETILSRLFERII